MIAICYISIGYKCREEAILNLELSTLYLRNRQS